MLVPRNKMENRSKKNTKDEAEATPREALNVDEVVKQAEIQTIPLVEIDRDNLSLQVREKVTEACKPENLVITDGVVEFVAGHPVILRKSGQRYHVVNGFRRLAAATNNADVTHVKVRVLTDVDENDTAIIASRINVAHGEGLSNNEKQRAFVREQTAHQAAGYKALSDRAWARLYQVSPSTIANWKKETASEAASAPDRRTLGRSQGDSSIQGGCCMTDPESNPNAGSDKSLSTNLPTEESPIPRVDTGSFEVTGSRGVTIGTAPPVTYARWLWRPSATLTQQGRLPKCFCIPFGAVPHPKRGRVWCPERTLQHTQSWEGFIGYACLAGLEILRHIQDLSDVQVFSYRVMQLLFRRRARFSEFLERQFSCSRDLYVRKGGREDEDCRTVLDVVAPELDVGKFMDDARATPEAKARENVSEADLIQIGLLQLAQKDPLKPSRGVEKRILRQALFDLDLNDNEVEEALKHPFVPRFLGALEQHIDDSVPDFDRWFKSEISHSFRHLAQQKKAPGGYFDPDAAKKVMLALVWQAFTHMGNCLHTFMAVLKHKIGDITPAEDSHFDRMWLRQPVFGDLPIILFRERFQTILPVLANWLFHDPPVGLESGVLYRLLQMYSTLVNARREADRRSKDVKAHAGLVRSLFTISDPSASSTEEERRDPSIQLREWVEAKKLKCENCGSAQLTLQSSASLELEQMVLEFKCETCNEINFITATREELANHLSPPK